jgi:hypothetical protein
MNHYVFGVRYIQQPEHEVIVKAATMRGAWTIAAATVTETWDDTDLLEAGYHLEFIRQEE